MNVFRRNYKLKKNRRISVVVCLDSCSTHSIVITTTTNITIAAAATNELQQQLKGNVLNITLTNNLLALGKNKNNNLGLKKFEMNSNEKDITRTSDIKWTAIVLSTYNYQPIPISFYNLSADYHFLNDINLKLTPTGSVAFIKLSLFIFFLLLTMKLCFSFLLINFSSVYLMLISLLPLFDKMSDFFEKTIFKFSNFANYFNKFFKFQFCDIRTLNRNRKYCQKFIGYFLQF
jgi:hypothetical protein